MEQSFAVILVFAVISLPQWLVCPGQNWRSNIASEMYLGTSAVRDLA